MRLKYIVTAALVLLPVIFITACGGGLSGTESASTQTSSPATTEEGPGLPVTPPTATMFEPTGLPEPTFTPPELTETPTPSATETQEPVETTTPPPTTTETTVTPEPTQEPEPTPEVFTLASTAFAYGQEIPSRYAYYVGNKSPEMEWSGAPAGTVSFAILMTDQDAGDFCHWVIYNIPAGFDGLDEGIQAVALLGNGIKQGLNDFYGIGYGGPAPPSGVHRYYFRIYALDTMLNFTSTPNRSTVLNAMQGHILATAEYMGTHSAS